MTESGRRRKPRFSPTEVGVIAAILTFLLGLFVPATIVARAYPKRERPPLSRVERTLLAYVYPGWVGESGLLRSLGVGVIAGLAGWAMARRKQGRVDETG